STLSQIGEVRTVVGGRAVEIGGDRVPVLVRLTGRDLQRRGAVQVAHECHVTQVSEAARALCFVAVAGVGGDAVRAGAGVVPAHGRVVTGIGRQLALTRSALQRFDASLEVAYFVEVSFEPHAIGVGYPP